MQSVKLKVKNGRGIFPLASDPAKRDSAMSLPVSALGMGNVVQRRSKPFQGVPSRSKAIFREKDCLFSASGVVRIHCYFKASQTHSILFKAIQGVFGKKIVCFLLPRPKSVRCFQTFPRRSKVFQAVPRLFPEKKRLFISCEGQRKMAPCLFGPRWHGYLRLFTPIYGPPPPHTFFVLLGAHLQTLPTKSRPVGRVN
jgi:hypothetical protein